MSAAGPLVVFVLVAGVLVVGVLWDMTKEWRR
jgi:hypothetical protein